MSDDSRNETASAKPDSDPERASPIPATVAPPPEVKAADEPVARGPHPALLAGIVATVAIVVFAAAIGGPWIYDDHNLIELNPYIHSFHWWRHWLTTDLWNVSITSAQHVRVYYYRPLVTISYAVDWAIGHGSPVVFHVTNLLWEATAGALVFFALRRWIGVWLPALLAALLFVVHPTKAQSVAWIAGRIDVMCAVWLLVASTGIAWRMRRRRGGLALEVAGTLLAYLTKETAIVLPAFVVIETWVALGRPAIDRSFSLRALKSAAPQLGVAIVYLVMHQLLMPIRGTLPAVRVPGNHLALVLATLGHAAELVLYPQHLMMQHGLLRINPTTDLPLYHPGFVALGALLLLAVGAGTWLSRRRAPGVTLGLLFFLVTLLPTANLIPTRLVELMPQRFLYIPLLGVSLVVGELVLRARWQRLVVMVCVVVTFLFAVRSVVRARDYSNAKRLWQHEIAVNPWSHQALLQLAYLDLNEHRYHDALHKFGQAYAITHRWFRASGSEVSLIIEAVDLIAYLTPDAQQQRLEKLDRFVTGALDPGGKKRVELSLDQPALHASIELDNPIAKLELQYLRPRLLITHAEIQSRIGNPDVAARAAEQADLACLGCSVLDGKAAVVLARSGRYAEARRVLATLATLDDAAMIEPSKDRIERAFSLHRQASQPGPRGLLARTRELAVLGAYGRAFAVLSPHERAIRQAPSMVMGYAELAWRAGHRDVARRVLAGRVSNKELNHLTAQWSQRMGWLVAGWSPPAH